MNNISVPLFAGSSKQKKPRLKLSRQSSKSSLNSEVSNLFSISSSRSSSCSSSASSSGVSPSGNINPKKTRLFFTWQRPPVITIEDPRYTWHSSILNNYPDTPISTRTNTSSGSPQKPTIDESIFSKMSDKPVIYRSDGALLGQTQKFMNYIREATISARSVQCASNNPKGYPYLYTEQPFQALQVQTDFTQGQGNYREPVGKENENFFKPKSQGKRAKTERMKKIEKMIAEIVRKIDSTDLAPVLHRQRALLQRLQPDIPKNSLSCYQVDALLTKVRGKLSPDASLSKEEKQNKQSQELAKKAALLAKMPLSEADIKTHQQKVREHDPRLLTRRQVREYGKYLYGQGIINQTQLNAIQRSIIKAELASNSGTENDRESALLPYVGGKPNDGSCNFYMDSRDTTQKLLEQKKFTHPPSYVYPDISGSGDYNVVPVTKPQIRKPLRFHRPSDVVVSKPFDTDTEAIIQRQNHNENYAKTFAKISKLNTRGYPDNRRPFINNISPFSDDWSVSDVERFANRAMALLPNTLPAIEEKYQSGSHEREYKFEKEEFLGVQDLILFQLRPISGTSGSSQFVTFQNGGDINSAQNACKALFDVIPHVARDEAWTHKVNLPLESGEVSTIPDKKLLGQPLKSKDRKENLVFEDLQYEKKILDKVKKLMRPVEAPF